MKRLYGKNLRVAMHFALVSAKCSGEQPTSAAPRRRAGLPEDPSGIRRVVFVGGRLRRLSAAPSVAKRLPVPRLRREQCLDNHKGATAMRCLPTADIADGGDDFRWNAETTSDMVPGDVVRHQPEARRERIGTPASLGVGKLPHSMGLVA